MKRLLPSLVALVLALALVVTGQSMAMARGMSGPDGAMVICTGNGPVMIYVDARGEPVAPPRLCPDCALSLIQGGIEQPPAILAPLRLLATVLPLPQASTTSFVSIIAQARDPPGRA